MLDIFMLSFRKFIESFDDLFADLEKRQLIKSEEKTLPKLLKLYRGFDADLESLEQDEQYYYFSPKKAEQGQLWFTHPYINAYNHIQYARDRGEWFMQYELPCVKHVKIDYWDDGSNSESLPEWWYQKVNPTQNSQYHAGIELPEGWVFSYKMEKFIGCKIKIKVPKNWITKNN
jgi:hypothetical protein